ncbi:Serine/threonine-protein kinase ATG1c [Pelomyxa schiedti]|nr:Serine/threonine-protein kinase ATG1c [Pelomyxa schiedti]
MYRGGGGMMNPNALPFDPFPNALPHSNNNYARNRGPPPHHHTSSRPPTSSSTSTSTSAFPTTPTTSAFTFPSTSTSTSTSTSMTALTEPAFPAHPNLYYPESLSLPTTAIASTVCHGPYPRERPTLSSPSQSPYPSPASSCLATHNPQPRHLAKSANTRLPPPSLASALSSATFDFSRDIPGTVYQGTSSRPPTASSNITNMPPPVISTNIMPLQVVTGIGSRPTPGGILGPSVALNGTCATRGYLPHGDSGAKEDTDSARGKKLFEECVIPGNTIDIPQQTTLVQRTPPMSHNINTGRDISVTQTNHYNDSPPSPHHTSPLPSPSSIHPVSTPTCNSLEIHAEPSGILRICVNNKEYYANVNYDCLSPAQSTSCSSVYKVTHNKQTFVAKIIKISSSSLQSVVSPAEGKKHRNLLELLDVGWKPDAICLITEYCAGGDLHSFIHMNNYIEEDVVAEIVFQLVAGLSFLHSRAIAHRDMKPANVLLCPDYRRVKIADFEMSKILQYEWLTTLCGTPGYMAPEVLVGQYDLKADIWALGVITYNLLFRAEPFEGITVDDINRNVQALHIRQPPKGFRSPAATQFTLGLLVPLSKRPDAKATLGHMWLAQAKTKFRALYQRH